MQNFLSFYHQVSVICDVVRRRIGMHRMRRNDRNCRSYQHDHQRINLPPCHLLPLSERSTPDNQFPTSERSQYCQIFAATFHQTFVPDDKRGVVRIIKEELLSQMFF